MLSDNDTFDAQQCEALQILFVEATIGLHPALLDCLQQQIAIYSGKLHPSLTHQLLRIYRSLQTDENGATTISVPTVQQQFGNCDCGLFAIAFTLHLAMGDDPQHIFIEQSQMRSHLLKCFQLSVAIKAWVGLTAAKIARALRVCARHRMLCNCGLLNTAT